MIIGNLVYFSVDYELSRWCEDVSDRFIQIRPVIFLILLIGYAQIAYNIGIQGSVLMMKCSGSDPLERPETAEMQRQLAAQRENDEANRESAARDEADNEAGRRAERDEQLARDNERAQQLQEEEIINANDHNQVLLQFLNRLETYEAGRMWMQSAHERQRRRQAIQRMRAGILQILTMRQFDHDFNNAQATN